MVNTEKLPRQFVFIGGLHKSGTTLLARTLAQHSHVSGFSQTGVPEDEGQHLQTVIPPASAHGGPGRFGFDPEAHLTEASSLVTPQNRARLLAEWSKYWDLTKPVLLEKSPPNLIRTRFLQALFPQAYFIIIKRHPVAVAAATWKWSRHSTPESLLEHWLVCHELFEEDRRYIRRVHEVRYEDLTERPQSTLATVLSFLNLRAEEMRIETRTEVQSGYFGFWEKRVTTEERRRLANIFAERVERSGYRYPEETTADNLPQ